MKCRIFNNDCMLVMDKMLEYNQKVDIVLTSPPYNTADLVQANAVEKIWKDVMMFI